jgi:hypothetical protein
MNGAQVYEWCGDADAFERSRYFGISKDIYQCAPARRYTARSAPSHI